MKNPPPHDPKKVDPQKLDKKKECEEVEPDGVDEASEESFPASDPPSYTSSAGHRGKDGNKED